MDTLIHFFEDIPSWQKLVWVLLCLSLSWLLEAVIPLFSFNYKKLNHIGVNAVFLSSDLIINVIFGLMTVGVFTWAADQQFGLLYLIEIPVWLELVIAVMILDFVAQYLVHYLLHRVPWMWRLHMIHHSDTHVDATTGTRHHPGDYLLREIFALLAIFVSGIPLAYYVFYRIVTVLFTYITHANINLPGKLDEWLSVLFITPNMHKFHHHRERPWTDKNFGNIFSLWDRMFGTMVYEDTTRIKYGLDVLDDNTDENIWYQLKIPFNKNIKTDPGKGFWW